MELENLDKIAGAAVRPTITKRTEAIIANATQAAELLNDCVESMELALSNAETAPEFAKKQLENAKSCFVLAATSINQNVEVFKPLSHDLTVILRRIVKKHEGLFGEKPRKWWRLWK